MTSSNTCYFTYGTWGGGEVNDFGKIFMIKEDAERFCEEQEKKLNQRWEIEKMELVE